MRYFNSLPGFLVTLLVILAILWLLGIHVHIGG